MAETAPSGRWDPMKTVTIVSCCDGRREGGDKDYEAAAIRLARSIRCNGGYYKDSDIAFWMDIDNQPAEETKRQLVGYGCELHYGKVPIEWQPMSSKIAACCLNFNTDYTIWMDTDIYVLDDFSALLDLDTDVAVSPTTRSHHRWAREEDIPLLDVLYKHFGLDRPEIKVMTHEDKELGNFYFCSGLIVFRSDIHFGKKYLEVAKGILGTNVESKDYAFTQTALPIIITKYELSYTIIPEWLHYVYGVHNHKLEYDNVAIVHYQDRRVTEVLDDMWEVGLSA